MIVYWVSLTDSVSAVFKNSSDSVKSVKLYILERSLKGLECLVLEVVKNE